MTVRLEVIGERMKDKHGSNDITGMKKKGGRSRETEASERVADFVLSCSDLELSNMCIRDATEVLSRQPAPVSQELLHEQEITFEWLVEREKLYRAAFALKSERPMSVDCVSKRLGFATVRHFSKAFENYFLIDPHRFRILFRKKIRVKQKNPS